MFDSATLNLFIAITIFVVVTVAGRDLLARFGMSKALALLILAMMVVHLIRPLGLPGLRARRDVWKIAVAALVAIGATVMLSHGS